MKTIKRKSAGFFLVELIIVLVIVGILVVMLMPTYQIYIARSKFTSVILKAEELKAAVVACAHSNEPPGFVGCHSGAEGIPESALKDPNGYVHDVAVTEAGVITGVSQNISVPNANNETRFTYILVPRINESNDVSWSVDPSSSCLQYGLCSRTGSTNAPTTPVQTTPGTGP